MLDGSCTKIRSGCFFLLTLIAESLVTWPRIIDAVLRNIDKEVEHMRQKADPSAKKARLARTQEDAARSLRSIVTLADCTPSTSHRAYDSSLGELGLRFSVADLLRHIEKVLKDESLHQAFLTELRPCVLSSFALIPADTSIF